MAGSDKRQRTELVQFRCTKEEHAAAEQLADRAGLALGAFARAAMLGSTGPRAQRRPPADHQALRQILGHLGSIGNNLNQIAYKLNSGQQASLPELKGCLRGYLELRDAIFQALGKTRAPEP